MNPIKINVIQPSIIPVSVSVDPAIDVELGTAINVKVNEIDFYEGSYEATPTNEEQYVDACGLVMKDAFVVHAIPSNYGLIEWIDGHIRVS